MVMPGDNVSMDVELIAPIAMDDGLRFAIREGGRTVGAGVVASITAVATECDCRRPARTGAGAGARFGGNFGRANDGQPEYPHPPQGL